MWASDMMGDHCIEHCQSYLLLSVMMVRLTSEICLVPAEITDQADRSRTIETAQKQRGPY